MLLHSCLWGSQMCSSYMSYIYDSHLTNSKKKCNSYDTWFNLSSKKTKLFYRNRQKTGCKGQWKLKLLEISFTDSMYGELFAGYASSFINSRNVWTYNYQNSTIIAHTVWFETSLKNLSEEKYHTDIKKKNLPSTIIRKAVKSQQLHVVT